MKKLIISAFFLSHNAFAGQYTGSIQTISCSSTSNSCWVILKDGSFSGNHDSSNNCQPSRSDLDLRKFYLEHTQQPSSGQNISGNNVVVGMLMSAHMANQTVTVRGRGCGGYYYELVDSVVLGPTDGL